MKVIESNIIYDNPLPQLESKHSFFPWLCQLKSGALAAVMGIGQAFESVDSTSCICFSYDEGKTWSTPNPIFDKKNEKITDYCKAICLENGDLVAIGYAYLRDDPSKPIGNPQTGGVLSDFVFWSYSEDEGKTWSPMQKIECSFSPYVEASAPITVLKNGDWMTPITPFPDWDGKMHSKLCGKALTSHDQGKTWDDSSVCMDFGDRKVTCYEQRMCQLDSQTIVCIGWNEDTVTGERLENHFTYSQDNGKTWSEPQSTKISGQASSLCALGGEKFLALHAVRRDTDKPGIYGYVIDFSSKEWNVIDSALLWEPDAPVQKDSKMADIFAFLKFGQPGAILLENGTVMMSHWFASNGQYKTLATKIEL